MVVKRFIFFCDFSRNAGLGHLMRSCALAKELILKEHIVYFVSISSNKKIISYLKKKKIKILPPKKNDIFSFLDSINFSKQDVLIIDNYTISLKSIAKLKQSGISLVVIDDMAKLKIDADIILNQNLSIDINNYKNSNSSQILFGRKYSLIRDEIKKIKKIKTKKINIFLSFGGGLFDSFIYKFLNVIKKIDNSLPIKVNLLFVINNFDKKNIQRNFKNLNNFNVKYLINKYDLSKYLAVSDFSINAGGVTSHEMIYLGIPQIAFSTAKNQDMNLKAIKKHNLGICMGSIKNFKENFFLDQLSNFIFNKKLKNKISIKCRKFIDGRGAERSAQKIINYYKKKY